MDFKISFFENGMRYQVNFLRCRLSQGTFSEEKFIFFEKNKNKKLERSVREKFLIHLRCSTNPIHFLLTHFSNHYAHWKKLLHILYINNILQLPGIVTHPRLDNYTNCGIYSLGSDNFPEPPPLSML